MSELRPHADADVRPLPAAPPDAVRQTQEERLLRAWKTPTGWRYWSAVNNSEVGVWYVSATFIFMAWLGGVDTYWGLILPSLANAQAVFLMRQFIQGLPDELFEAARIDGAGEFRIFLRIVLPLCKPVLATLGIFVFLWHWNDFLWPLIVGKSSDMWTLTVGISSLQQQSVPLSVMLAGSVVALLPIFLAYLVAQRYVQEGVASAGIKG